jgi:hypothetical protein
MCTASIEKTFGGSHHLATRVVTNVGTHYRERRKKKWNPKIPTTKWFLLRVGSISTLVTGDARTGGQPRLVHAGEWRGRRGSVWAMGAAATIDFQWSRLVHPSLASGGVYMKVARIYPEPSLHPLRSLSLSLSLSLSCGPTHAQSDNIRFSFGGSTVPTRHNNAV